MQSGWVSYAPIALIPRCLRTVDRRLSLIADYRCEICVKRETAIIWNNPKHITTSFENSYLCMYSSVNSLIIFSYWCIVKGV